MQSEALGAAHVGEWGRTPFPVHTCPRCCQTSWYKAPCPCALFRTPVLGLVCLNLEVCLVLFCLAGCLLVAPDKEETVKD